MTPARPIRSVDVLGVPVSIVDLAGAVETIRSWCAAGKANYVCIRDEYGVMRAQDDPVLHDIHEKAGMVTPDGMPLVWLTRLRGIGQAGASRGRIWWRPCARLHLRRPFATTSTAVLSVQSQLVSTEAQFAQTQAGSIPRLRATRPVRLSVSPCRSVG